MTRKNIIFGGLEFFVLAILQFATFRIVVVYLGLDALGVWSVMISSIQITKFLDPGIASGSLRFVVKAKAENRISDIIGLVASAFIVTAGLYIVLIAIFFIPIEMLFTFALPNQVDLARSFYPYVMAGFFLQSISNLFALSLVNIGKSPTKSTIAMLSALIQFVASIFLIQRSGLVGLAVAQILNSLVVLLCSSVVLHWSLGAKLRHWLNPAFSDIKKIAATGSLIQINSIAWTAFEMLARVLVSRVGGAATAGSFEVAYRVATQVRLLFFFAFQPLAATLSSKSLLGELISYFTEIYSRTIGFAVVLCLGAFVAVGPIYYFVFGHFGSDEAIFAICTLIGTLVHIIALPAELAGVAHGLIKWNLLGTVVKVSILGLLGVGLGYAIGATGVAIALAVAILVGSLLTVILNSRALHLPLTPDTALLTNIDLLRRGLQKLKRR